MGSSDRSDDSDPSAFEYGEDSSSLSPSPSPSPSPIPTPPSSSSPSPILSSSRTPTAPTADVSTSVSEIVESMRRATRVKRSTPTEPYFYKKKEEAAEKKKEGMKADVPKKTKPQMKENVETKD